MRHTSNGNSTNQPKKSFYNLDRLEFDLEEDLLLLLLLLDLSFTDDDVLLFCTTRCFLTFGEDILLFFLEFIAFGFLTEAVLAFFTFLETLERVLVTFCLVLFARVTDRFDLFVVALALERVLTVLLETLVLLGVWLISVLRVLLVLPLLIFVFRVLLIAAYLRSTLL